MPDATGGQIIGRRAEQQDGFGRGTARLSGGAQAPFFILCDGMGGHGFGAQAASLALDAALAQAESGSSANWRELLDQALLSANRAIGEHVRENPRCKGMGCTLVAVVLDLEDIHFISVGDSPLYQLKPNGLARINADHSMTPYIDKAVIDGTMSAEEARNHPDRSALRSAVTGGPIALTDCQTVEIGTGDWLILASDGLFTLDEPEVVRTILAEAPRGSGAIVAALLDAVAARGTEDQDNCTVIAVRTEVTGSARRGVRPADLLLLTIGFALLGLVALLVLRPDWLHWPSSDGPASAAPTVQTSAVTGAVQAQGQGGPVLHGSLPDQPAAVSAPQTAHPVQARQPAAKPVAKPGAAAVPAPQPTASQAAAPHPIKPDLSVVTANTAAAKPVPKPAPDPVPAANGPSHGVAAKRSVDHSKP